MKSISAHITGFYHSSFHAYTTEVTVDGHRWRLGLRYSKFHEFYDQLVVQEKDFHAAFPPKGTLFFTPKPEERQEQLEIFLQQVLAYYSTKRYPMKVENLLCDLLKVPRHLRCSDRDDDDDVSTSTESVLDEPMHEPAAIEKKDLKEEETKTIQVAETKEVAETLEIKADEPRSVELKEAEKIVPITIAQVVSEVADEPLSVELEKTEQAALDTAEAAKVVTPALVEESEVAEETFKEDVAIVDEVVVEEEETDSPSPLVPAVQLAAKTEDAVQKDTVFESRLQISSLEETDVVLPTEQLVIKSVAHERTPLNSQVDEERAVSEDPILEEEVKPKEVATSEQASSWIAAYLPKSLVLFFQHRCMKKTNIVVLCVALLLPMAFARFNYTTFHTYTTEVEVDGHTWTLHIRYNTFYQFYERLLAIEKYFMVKFPPKGSLFFSPSPEERQEELDEFMLGTLAYFDMRDHPKRMGALLDELLEISKNLVVKDEEEERTASEGSFDVIDDFLESGHDTLQPIVADENQVKAAYKLDPHQSIKEDKAMEMEVEMEMQQKKVAVAKAEAKPATSTIDKNTTSKLDTVSILDPKSEEKIVKENELFSQEKGQESDLESDTESENPVVCWFRRIISFGSSPDEKEEEAVHKQYEEEDEQGNQEASMQAETEVIDAEACTKAEEGVKAEAMKAELLLAAQELNLRLKRYRHPVFFRDFNCNVKASCFFMPQRLSSDILAFNRVSFCTYTTVVTLDGVSWTLAIRYSKFLAFYDQLRAAERSFKFNFPPKGGFFSTPKPEDRQPRLDAFLQAVMAFFLKRKQPGIMTKLLREFLQIDKSLREAKKAQKAKEEEEQTASDESANEESNEVSKPKGEDEKKKTKEEEKKKKIKLSDKAQVGKKALVNAAAGAEVASAIKDEAVKTKKEGKEEEKKVKVEEIKVKVEEKKVKVDDIKVALNVEEMKVEKVAAKEEVEVKVEQKEKVAAKEEVEVNAEDKEKVEVQKVEVKVEQKKEESMTEEPKVYGVLVEEAKVANVKTSEVKPTTTSTTTTRTTTTTTSNGSTVVETNVTSQPTASKTVVGKTVTVTSNADDIHSFRVEMTEKKASVITLSAAAKEIEMVEAVDQKPKKKNRSQSKENIQKAPLSSASTVSDGFESPGGVDEVGRVSDLSESQKKARNQRRKEKRKKKQKKASVKDLKV
ncbi:hypothetical protein DD238_005299 [Peronospora effusa]|uniref:PX domain-containing protein n=1 Tax=Peronospora effusa TaxID=542832 RepID=A0A3M6VQZ3_9STRA|nr:hypothetical protein DD238_005299 [Peronospora effusa]